MKIKKTILFFIISIFILFSSISITYVKASADEYYLGGFPAGFSLNTRGACILGLTDVVTEKGIVSPSKTAGLMKGDVIMSIDGNETNCAFDIEKYTTNQKTKLLVIKRGDEQLSINIIPAKDMVGKYRLGVFIRDTVNGIGTITYIKNDRFASLGHPVLDDDGSIIPIVGGNLFLCNVNGCIKGERGKAGELRGAFVKRNYIAEIDINCENGVYGKLNQEGVDEFCIKKVEVGTPKPGNATIYSTIEGNAPKEYKISIIKADCKNGYKNLVIRITDKDLLEKTGGIVQGMSGSPILQNGKLVGGVTHVFINDPTRGFGIDIKNMQNN